MCEGEQRCCSIVCMNMTLHSDTPRELTPPPQTLRGTGRLKLPARAAPFVMTVLHFPPGRLYSLRLLLLLISKTHAEKKARRGFSSSNGADNVDGLVVSLTAGQQLLLPLW